MKVILICVTSLDGKIARDSDRLNIVFTSKAKRLQSQPGVLEYTAQKPREVVESLGKRGFKKAMLIGGSRLNASFLQDSLIDEIWLTVVGVIFGQGLSLFESGKYNFPAKLLSFHKLGEKTILLKYQIKK